MGVGKKVYPDGKEKEGKWEGGKFVEFNSNSSVVNDADSVAATSDKITNHGMNMVDDTHSVGKAN